LDTLLAIECNDKGERNDPMSNLPFTLRDIQPAPDIQAKIEKYIDACLPNYPAVAGNGGPPSP